MHAVVKLIIGLLILVAGIAWYVYPSTVGQWLGTPDSITSLKIIFAGVIGLVLIIFGLLLTWINIEEIKESRIEKKEEKKK